MFIRYNDDGHSLLNSRHVREFYLDCSPAVWTINARLGNKPDYEDHDNYTILAVHSTSDSPPVVAEQLFERLLFAFRRGEKVFDLEAAYDDCQNVYGNPKYQGASTN